MKTFTTLVLCSVLAISTLQAQSQILDSMTVRTFVADTQLWADTDKEEYAFDGRGNLTLFINYDWNENTQELLPIIKEAYTYDDQDRQTNYVTYAWNTSTSTWTPNLKIERTYNEWGQTLSLSYNWNEDTQEWIYSVKAEKSYSANGNITLSAGYSWDINTEQWVGINNKYETTHDGNNNIILNVKYAWDTDAGQWMEDEKYEYTYTDSLLVLHSVYNWNTNAGQWINLGKGEYSYDNDGRQILLMHYRWEESSEQWIDNFKEEDTYTNNSHTYEKRRWNNESDYWEPVKKYHKIYDDEKRIIAHNSYITDCCAFLLNTRGVWEYDEDGNLLRSASDEWNSGIWVTVFESIYTYDSNGNLLTNIDIRPYPYDSKQEYIYDTNNNRIEYRYYEREDEYTEWKPIAKTEWDYDDANYKISTIRSTWNESTQEWAYQSKETHTYDNVYTYNDLILPPFEEYKEDDFEGKRTNHTRYIWENGEWVYEYEENYHYSTTPVSTTYPEINHRDILIYPNPTHNILNIKSLNNQKINSASLFDLAGRQVSHRIIADNTLNISALPQGMYWVKIEIGEDIFYKKIVVR